MLRFDHVRLHTGRQVYENGCVLVDGNSILYAGDECAAPKTSCVRINGKGGILMPGLYNAHTHAAMTLMRGVGSDLSLMDWLNQIFPIEDRLNDEILYWGTMLGIAEMLRRGAVGMADMYFRMWNSARAALDSGIRANLTRGCNSIEGVDSIKALMDEYHGAGNGRLRVSMGLHSEYTSTPEVARYAIETAGKLGLAIHTHASETRFENEGCIERHGVTPIRYFKDLGLFEHPAILAHCLHLTEEDVAILSESNAYAVHNPVSNLKLGSGIMRLNELLRAGVKVALGTDGASSNNRLDMFSEMHLASILQKGIRHDPTAITAQEALSIATRNGALACGWDDCGLIEKGMKADMILLDGEAENLLPCADVTANIVYAAEGLNVRMTMVDGKIVYQDGRFTMFDIEEVRAKALEAARALGVIA